MLDWLGLAGARVLVAGAGGIGGAVSRGFLEAGARLAVVDADESRVRQLDSELQLTGNGHLAMVADVLSSQSATEVVEGAASEFDGIDVFVHCIGINDRRPIAQLTEADWDAIIDTNLKSAFLLGSCVGRIMLAQGSGRLVFFSSVAGLMAHKNHAPYAASKGGLNQLMRSMASEWAEFGVRANAIAPGYVETPLTSAHLEKPGVRENLVKLVPTGRLGTTDQLVGPALFLASVQSEFITGQVLYVDGGRTLV